MKKTLITLLISMTAIQATYAQKNKKDEYAYANLAFTEIKDEILILTNQNQLPYCPNQSYMRAYQGTRNPIRGFVINKEFCWDFERKGKDNIIIFDPKASFFKTTKIPEKNFKIIKTKAEIEAEERKHTPNLSQGPIPMIINGELTLCHTIGGIINCD